MTRDELKHTKDWWTCLCNDEALMSKWVFKLHGTEYGGYVDHKEFLEKNPDVVMTRAGRIIENIGGDELKHAGYLRELIAYRGWSEGAAATPKSTYWDAILSSVATPEDYYAANYYGESAACDRFEVIRSMSCTPEDIKGFIEFALPDEIFHRVTLAKLAGEETLYKFEQIHQAAMALIVKRNPSCK